MNRPIKFRAWNKVRKVMTKPLTIEEWRDDAVDAESMNETSGWSLGAPYGAGESFNWKDLVLMQFTGLLDKNKNPIFEGDVVNFDYGHGQGRGSVFFKNGSYMTTFHEMSGNNFLGTDRPPKIISEREDVGFEVIGNMWENPSLLKSP
jgi:uncharacterized phage protein (TIGR01671 family)